MGVSRMVRYGMEFSGKWADLSALFTGVSFFLVVLYFYVFGHVQEAGAVEKIFSLILPMILLGVYALLIRVVKLDVPLVYAVIAGVYCVSIIVSDFGGHGVAADVVAIVGYLLCAAALVISVLGLFPGKWIAVGLFFLCAVLRFWMRDYIAWFYGGEVIAAMPDAATLSGVMAMCTMGGMLKRRKRKKKTE